MKLEERIEEMKDILIRNMFVKIDETFSNKNFKKHARNSDYLKMARDIRPFITRSHQSIEEYFEQWDDGTAHIDRDMIELRKMISSSYQLIEENFKTSYATSNNLLQFDRSVAHKTGTEILPVDIWTATRSYNLDRTLFQSLQKGGRSVVRTHEQPSTQQPKTLDEDTKNLRDMIINSYQLIEEPLKLLRTDMKNQDSINFWHGALKYNDLGL